MAWVFFLCMISLLDSDFLGGDLQTSFARRNASATRGTHVVAALATFGLVAGLQRLAPLLRLAPASSGPHRRPLLPYRQQTARLHCSVKMLEGLVGQRRRS